MAENYDLIFGQSASQQYAWSDSDYQNGWQTVGSTPPTAEQFDALQRKSDMKAKDLNDRLSPLETKAEADGRQAATEYAEGVMVTADGLPNGWLLECVVAGTTGAGALVIPSPLVIGGTIVDGTVTWTVNRNLPLFGGGALTGDDLTWNGADLGGSAIVAKSLVTNGYIKYASGKIEQWGLTGDFTGATKTVTFPVSFTTDAYIAAVCSPINVGIAGATSIKVNSASQATVTRAVTTYVNGSSVYWYAVGK